jgi:inner membrane protein
VDVLAYLDGPAADLSFRRGWTHGIPALVVLPFVLTAAIVGLDRLIRRVNHAALPSGVRPRQVLLLAAVSILTHPILDTLNTYGVRWLMPIRGDWHYGDTLFIVDPWVWLVLVVGVVLSSGRRSTRGFRPDAGRGARVALGAALVYIVVMAGAGLAARTIVSRELSQSGGPPIERLMVGPRPLTPFMRQVVAARGSRYVVGTFRWIGRPHITGLRDFPRPAADDPRLAAARTTTLGRRFLGWARFPIVLTEPSPEGTRIHLVDLRYTDRPGSGFGSATLTVAGDQFEVIE